MLHCLVKLENAHVGRHENREDEESAAGLFERTSVYGRSASPTRRPKTEPRRKRPLQTLSLETEEEAPSPFARERQPSLVSPAKASGREMRTGRMGGDLTPSQQKKSFSSSFDAVSYTHLTLPTKA